MVDSRNGFPRRLLEIKFKELEIMKEELECMERELSMLQERNQPLASPFDSKINETNELKKSLSEEPLLSTCQREENNVISLTTKIGESNFGIY